MQDVQQAPIGGQGPAPSDDRPWTRSRCLRLTPEEAQRARTFIRKTACKLGGFKALAARLDIPSATLYYNVNLRRRPSAIVLLRVAGVAEVSVESVIAAPVETPTRRAA